MADPKQGRVTNGGRRGAALILGCGLLAGGIAAVITWSLPVQYVSVCQMRQRQDAAPLLQSLDLADGGTGMRAFMAEPAVWKKVAMEPGLLRDLGFSETEESAARFTRFAAAAAAFAAAAGPAPTGAGARKGVLVGWGAGGGEGRKQTAGGKDGRSPPDGIDMRRAAGRVGPRRPRGSAQAA